MMKDAIKCDACLSQSYTIISIVTDWRCYRFNAWFHIHALEVAKLKDSVWPLQSKFCDFVHYLFKVLKKIRAEDHVMRIYEMYNFYIKSEPISPVMESYMVRLQQYLFSYYGSSYLGILYCLVSRWVLLLPLFIQAKSKKDIRF